MLDRFNSLTFSAAEIDELFEYYSRYGSDKIDLPTRDDFLEFSRTGNRLNYENKYFALRHRINGAFMMCRAKGNEYSDELRALIRAVCDEETWALPAHVSNLDNARTEIDLFAAETAMMLAEIKYLAGANGDSAATGASGDILGAELNDRIDKEIRERIFVPFSKNKYHWETAAHNWSAVCAGAIGIAYLRLAPDELPLDRILNAMDAYISGYSDDGICLEGIGYWSYGFGFYMYFGETLFETRFSEAPAAIDIIHMDKIRCIAAFPENAALSGSSESSSGTDSTSGNGETLISCSDAPAEFAAPEGLMGMISEFYGATSPVRTVKTDECGRWAHFIRSYLYPVKGKTEPPATGEYIYEQSQWYVNRKPRYGFFIKGGTNGEPHNHNDIGSFIIADKSGQILCDLGAGEYTRDYFNDETRYNYLCNSSLGHSVPIIDGKGQFAGAEYRCDAFNCGSNSARVLFGNAYGNNAAAVREVKLHENKIVLRDTFKFTDEKPHIITERFVTLIEPVITDSGILIGDLKINKTGEIKKEIIRAHDGTPKAVYLMDFNADMNFEIEFMFI